MGRLRPRALVLFGTILVILGAAVRTAARLAGRHQSADPAITSAITGAIAPARSRVRSRAIERSRFRARALLLGGVTCVVLGVALYAGTRLAEPPQSAADPATTSTISVAVAPTLPNATSPATDAAGTTPSASPAVTLTTIEPAALQGRLAQIAATVGFTILGLKAPGWKLAAVDTQTQGGESFAAVSYVRGSSYVTITQQRMATPPTHPGAEPTTIRGQAGTLALMNPVVLLRWQEQGVAMMLTTNLPREAALSLTDQLEPVP